MSAFPLKADIRALLSDSIKLLFDAKQRAKVTKILVSQKRTKAPLCSLSNL